MRCSKTLAVTFLLFATVSSAAHARSKYDFELYDLSDKLVKSKSLRSRNKLLLVEFFALSCGPCKRSLPFLKKLQQRYGKKGLSIVVIALPDDDDKTRAFKRATRFLKPLALPFPIVWDKYLLTAKRYKVATKDGLRLPRVFLLDRAGHLIKRAKRAQKIASSIKHRMSRR